MKEVDIGAAVVSLFRSRGYEVYQEVLCRTNQCVDLVATRGEILAAVECKVALTYEVMWQALRWKGHAHNLYVAVGFNPHPRGFNPHPGVHPLAVRLLRDIGVGLIAVYSPERAVLEVKSRTDPSPDEFLREHLRDEHKTFAPAGSSGAARWSPFKATVLDLQAFVASHPGCSMAEASAGIRHHYKSPRSCASALAHWLHEGAIKGIRVERMGKAMRLFAEGAPRAPLKLAGGG